MAVFSDDEEGSVAMLGDTIRVERRRRGWSVQTLSERAGVSFGLVSSLERGQGNPTYKALYRIASALEVPLTKLLVGRDRDAQVVRKDERFELPAEPGMPRERQIHRTLLTPRSETALRLVCATLPVAYTRKPRPLRHLGTEVVTVVSGRLIAGFGDREVTLDVGDAATYPCSTPNWWANAAESPTVVLSATTPIES